MPTNLPPFIWVRCLDCTGSSAFPLSDRPLHWLTFCIWFSPMITDDVSVSHEFSSQSEVAQSGHFLTSTLLLLFGSSLLATTKFTHEAMACINFRRLFTRRCRRQQYQDICSRGDTADGFSKGSTDSSNNGSLCTLLSSPGQIARPQPPPPPFLQLPADIVLHLCSEHLPTASAASLSLTCRALFALLFPKLKVSLDKQAAERKGLLLLLEKDLGQSWWFCHTCSLLHPISSQGPIGGVYGQPRKSTRPDHDSRSLNASGFSIDYQTVRLAMNRHFYGPPNGLPLENLYVETFSDTVLPWEEVWSARIIQDELFLSATRTVSGIDWTDETMRAALDREWHEICGHVRTSGPPFACVTALRCAAPRPADYFIPCRDVVESCHRCLTDYTTTVERKVGYAAEGPRHKQPAAYWLITVTAYYRLGSCRSPRDTKWDTFGRRRTPAAYHMQRDTASYPRGSIKEMWESHEPQARSGTGTQPRGTTDSETCGKKDTETGGKTDSKTGGKTDSKTGGKANNGAGGKTNSETQPHDNTRIERVAFVCVVLFHFFLFFLLVLTLILFLFFPYVFLFILFLLLQSGTTGGGPIPWNGTAH